MKENSNTKYRGIHGVSDDACYNISIVNTIIWQAGLINPKRKAPSLVQATILMD